MGKNYKTMDFSETILVYDIEESIFSNFFYSKTDRPIDAKGHGALPCDKGMEVSSNSLGHIAKFAAMPIYGKNIQKSSSLEPKG